MYVPLYVREFVWHSRGWCFLLLPFFQSPFLGLNTQAASMSSFEDLAARLGINFHRKDSVLLCSFFCVSLVSFSLVCLDVRPLFRSGRRAAPALHVSERGQAEKKKTFALLLLLLLSLHHVLGRVHTLLLFFLFFSYLRCGCRERGGDRPAEADRKQKKRLNVRLRLWRVSGKWPWY